MSGVEPHLLKEAFDTFKDSTVCESAEMVMNIQKVKIECNACGVESELEKNEYLCPLCQSADIKVVDGEDMYLMQLELEWEVAFQNNLGGNGIKPAITFVFDLTFGKFRGFKTAPLFILISNLYIKF